MSSFAKILLLSTTLLLGACMHATGPQYDPSELSAQPTALKRSNVGSLYWMQGPNGPPVTIAVYSFGDKTGQRKPNDKFSVLSSAVTQGAEVFLIKALQDAGGGKWFQVVERVGLDDLVKERQLIRNQRETYEGKEAKQLPPMLVAGVMLEGGIVGYDTDTLSGGVGAKMLGIGADTNYRVDVVTTVIRLISVQTGEVLVSAGATKTIYSKGSDANVFTFVDASTMSIQMEAGSAQNEPTTFAVRLATEAAVVDMINQGVKKGLWEFAPRPQPAAAAPAAKQEVAK